MNYYQNVDILNSKRKQLYFDIQDISNDKELTQYLKNTASNIDSLLESLFDDEGDYEENKVLVQEILEFHIASLENLKNKLQPNLQESIRLQDILFEMMLGEDRCKRIADRRYDKPSAYKSGAIVRCRKGKIWKDIKSEAFFIGKDKNKIDYYIDKNGNKFQTIDVNYLQYPGLVVVKYDDGEPIEYKGNFEADLKSGIIKYLNSEIDEAFFIGEDDIKLNEKQKETLRTWFKRKGAPGKTGGWIDCNTCREVDGKTKCKPCGRQKGEKRAKYPSCRPTPSQCKQPGKGKKWGKTK